MNMFRIFVLVLIICSWVGFVQVVDGFIVVQSSYSVVVMVDKLEVVLVEKGMMVMNWIDYLVNVELVGEVF